MTIVHIDPDFAMEQGFGFRSHFAIEDPMTDSQRESLAADNRADYPTVMDLTDYNECSMEVPR